VNIPDLWKRFSGWWEESIRPRLGPPVAGKLTAGDLAILFVLLGILAVVPFAISQSEQADAILSGILLTVYSLGAIILLLVAGRATIKQAAFQMNRQDAIRRVGTAWLVLSLGLFLNTLAGKGVFSFTGGCFLFGFLPGHCGGNLTFAISATHPDGTFRQIPGNYGDQPVCRIIHLEFHR
jgi:MFS family permease